MDPFGFPAYEATRSSQKTAPPAGTLTSLTGTLLDANSAVLGSTVPIVGAEVAMLNSANGQEITPRVTTDANGVFTIPDIPAIYLNLAVIMIDSAPAAPAPDGAAYAGFREPIDLIPLGNNATIFF